MANSEFSEAVDEYIAILVQDDLEDDEDFMGYASGHGVCVYMPEFDKVAVIGLIRVEDA